MIGFKAIFWFSLGLASQLAIAGCEIGAENDDSGIGKENGDETNAISVAGEGDTSVSCEWDYPATDDQANSMHANLYLKEDSGEPTIMYYCNSPAECEQTTRNGWYYDDPADPARVLLCPDACETLQSLEKVRISMEFGCRPIAIDSFECNIESFELN